MKKKREIIKNHWRVFFREREKKERESEAWGRGNVRETLARIGCLWSLIFFFFIRLFNQSTSSSLLKRLGFRSGASSILASKNFRERWGSPRWRAPDQRRVAMETVRICNLMSWFSAIELFVAWSVDDSSISTLDSL